MKITFLFVFTLASTLLFSQYSTPGTGVVWNMDSLVANSNGNVIHQFEDTYLINSDLNISINDSLNITDKIIEVEGGVTLSIVGSIHIDGFLNAIYPIGLPHFGLILEENSIGFFRNVNFPFIGGIKVLTENFHMEDCSITDHSPAFTTEAAIEIYNGKPVFLNNYFAWNDVSAISSPSNSQVAPRIESNEFIFNVLLNTINAHINLGSSGASDTTMIIGNTFTGHVINQMAGGITIASTAGGEGHFIIQNNTFQNNRYGIDIIGNNLTTKINSNLILGLSIQNDPFMMGSLNGINLNGNSTSFAIISDNEIRHHMWGMTMQGSFMANLGDNDNIDSPGLNVFAENGIDGQLQAFFNNTPNDVPAMFNCWNDTLEPLTLEIAESVIFHQVDDSELGEVFFEPLGECAPVGVNEGTEFNLLIDLFPNPARESITLEWPSEFNFETFTVLSSTGQMSSEFYGLEKTKLVIDVKGFSSGIYYLIIQSKNGIITKKFVRS